MGSSKHGKPLLEVLLLEFVLLLVLVVVVVLVGGMSGCAVYPRTLASTPLESIVEKVELTWGVGAGPNDEVEIPVKVKEMRAALATAERYKGAVKLQNLAVDQIMVMVEAYDGAARDVELAKRAGMWNTLVGVGGGVAIGALIVLLVR